VSLLSARNSKGVSSHPQLLVLLNNIQCACLNNDYSAHLESFNFFYLETFFFSTLIVVTDVNTILSRNMQAISAMHFWRLDHKMSFSKTPASKTTTSNAELFAIRLGVSKATSMDIEHIILITDSLSSDRRSVDPSVYSRQVYFLTICSALRLFFSSVLTVEII